MPTSTLRCAIVGLYQGLEDVYTTLHHPRYTLVAVCSSDRRPWEWLSSEQDIEKVGDEVAIFDHHKRWVKNARESAGFAGVEFISDFDQVLAREDIDAVVLVLPDTLHATFTIKALNAGKYVLCTKPMARTMEEALEIAKVAKEHPEHYMLGLQLSYSNFVSELMEIIASGEIGTLRQIRFDFHRGPWRPVHRKKYGAVDGAMIKEGVHWLDMIYRLSGQLPWRAMSGFGGRDTFPDDFKFEDNGVLIIDYEGFRAAHTFTCFRHPTRHEEDFLMVGEKGTIRGTFDAFQVETDAGVRDVVVKAETLPEQHHIGYYKMHEAFTAMCLDGITPHSNWQTGLENMLTAYAAQIAVAEGRTVHRNEFENFDWRLQFDTPA